MIELLGKIWQSLNPFQPQILAFLLTLAGTLVVYFFRARVKLIYGHANNSFHALNSETGPISVFCEKHFIQNVGRKSAEKVEIAFSCSPSELSIYPPRSFERVQGLNGALILKIPYVAPKELIIVDTIHVNSPTAELRAIHCAESRGRKVNFWVLRKFAPSFYWFWVIVSFLGIFYAAQLAITFVAYLVRAGS